MTKSNFNYEDPSNLLDQMTKHRSNLKYLDQVELWKNEILSKTAEVEKLVELKKPFDSEIEKLMRMRERGFLDRIGYRESLEEFQPKQLEFQRKINKLLNECSIREAQILNYERALAPSVDFFSYIEIVVVNYSIVKIQLRDEIIEYLMVPDTIRQSYQQSKVELLATNSALGSVLLNQEVGIVSSVDHRFKGLEILSTKIVDEETLHFLAGLYRSNQQDNVYRFKDRVLGSGDVQRWRDARVNELVNCNRCATLYPLGDTCNCFS